MNGSTVDWGDDERMGVKGGDETAVVCRVESTPPSTLSWTKDDSPLPDTSNLSSDNTTLRLPYFADEDVGVYKCHISWRQSEFVASVELFLTNPVSRINKILIFGLAGTILSMFVGGGCLELRLRREKRKSEAAKEVQRLLFNEGKLDQLNPDKTADEQAELLPYDKSFEVSRDRICIGREIGSGVFGRVVMADVTDLVNGEETTPVAVKMCKSEGDASHMKNLAIELKIMIHLGKHLNIVNLLGAYTSDIIRGELWLLMEYCEYGDLLSFLHRSRKIFVDQIDPVTGNISYNDQVSKPLKSLSPQKLERSSEITESTCTNDHLNVGSSPLLSTTLISANPSTFSGIPRGQVFFQTAQSQPFPSSRPSQGSLTHFASNPGYGFPEQISVQDHPPGQVASDSKKGSSEEGFLSQEASTPSTSLVLVTVDKQPCSSQTPHSQPFQSSSSSRGSLINFANNPAYGVPDQISLQDHPPRQDARDLQKGNTEENFLPQKGSTPSASLVPVTAIKQPCSSYVNYITDPCNTSFHLPTSVQPHSSTNATRTQSPGYIPP